MPAKIRLQRKGKKGQPFYHIVIADGRAPREGRFIERIGTYNPLTRPAEIDIDFDKAIGWLQNGAQPTDTVKAILAYKGVLYKSHLLKGVKKGAMTLEQAEAKFQAWLQEKNQKIASKVNEVALTKKEAKKKQLAYETEVNEAKATAIAKKLAKEAEAEARKHEEPVAEEPVAQEEVAQEEAAQEEAATEQPVAEVPVADESAETPAAEEPKQE
jgi:small subunit ribosomal protein S16